MWFLQPLLSGVPGIERVRMTIYYAQETLFGKFNYIVKQGWVLIIKTHGLIVLRGPLLNCPITHYEFF